VEAKNGPIDKMKAAAGTFVEKLQCLSGVCPPAKIESKRWADVSDGAREIAGKVDQLLKHCQTWRAQTAGLDVAQDGFVEQLNQLSTEFAEYQRQATQVPGGSPPELIAGALKREAEMWGRWSETAILARDRCRQITEKCRKDVVQLDYIEPMLRRLRPGAEKVVVLAGIMSEASQLQLDEMVEQINAIIGQFNTLSDQARDALTSFESGLQPATRPDLRAAGSRELWSQRSKPMVPVAPPAPKTDGYRSWSYNGKKWSEAKLVSVEGTTITLRTRDGQLYMADTARLSPSDLAVVSQFSLAKH
jgi:hypothetical protein